VDRAFYFEGLAGSHAGKIDEEALSCLKNNYPELKNKIMDQREEAIKSNLADTDQYIEESFEKSLLAATLFKQAELVEKKFEEIANKKGIKKGWSLNFLGRSKVDKSVKEDYEKEREAALKEIYDSIRALSVNSPLLFSTKNKFKILDWYNAKITPSSLSKEITGNIPEALQTKMLKSFEGKSVPQAIESFQSLVKGDLQAEVAKYKESQLAMNKKKIKEELKKSAQEFSKEVFESVGANCKDDGSYIHLNEQIVAAAADEIYARDDLTDEQKKQELMSLQSWQCKAWRDHPPEDIGKLTITRIGGFASLGLGAAMMLTGVGAGVGAGLMSLGGLAFTGNAVWDYFKYQPEMIQQKTSYHLGWRDSQAIEEARDQNKSLQTQIAADAALISTGAIFRFAKVPAWLNSRKVTKNIELRETDDPIADIKNYTNLVMDRHDVVLKNGDKVRVVGDDDTLHTLNNVLRSLSKYDDVPQEIAKYNKNFKPMLDQLTDVTKKASERDLAFNDLAETIMKYKNYPNKVEDAIRRGRNAKLMMDVDKKYLKVIKRSHFKKNAPLPQVEEGLEIKRIGNGNVLSFKYQVAKKGSDKLETVEETFENYNDFIRFTKNNNMTYKKAYAFDLKDEALRNSDVLRVLDEQARLYSELKIVRSKLVKVGKNYDPKSGLYENLSFRQNTALRLIDRTLESRKDLYPRADAVKALAKKEMVSESKSILLGKKLYLKGSKYNDESLEMVKEGVSRIKKYAPLGAATIGTGGVSMIVNSTTDRVGAGEALQGLKENLRYATRRYNHFWEPAAPVGFTTKERTCAEAARGWSVENDCLMGLINSQVLAKAGIRERRDPEYNMLEDDQLMSDVRQYIRDQYRLRKHFTEGKKTQLAQSLMKDVAGEMANEELIEYIRDTALKNGLTLLDKGIIGQDVANQLRDKLMDYKENPIAAIEAYDRILEEYSHYEANFIQNPEMPPKLQSLISEVILEQVKLDSDNIQSEQ